MDPPSPPRGSGGLIDHSTHARSSTQQHSTMKRWADSDSSEDEDVPRPSSFASPDAAGSDDEFADADIDDLWAD